MAELPKYFYFRITPVTNKGVLTQIMVDDASNADVVEVVRCKDCINWNGNNCITMYGLFAPNPNDYCSRGERLAYNG
jgi:hypothetical protein